MHNTAEQNEGSQSTHGTHSIPLAIIGFSFEFPQEATSTESFWQMVCDGRNTSSEFPKDRFNIDGFYHPDEERPSSIPLRGGHFLKESLDAFDAPFFSITPNEAACMDPQHRRMLETAYHALEDAGIPVTTCSGSNTSVYTGCFTNDYLSILHQDYDAEQKHAAMGLVPSMMANRLSWFFNFKGTSMNLDSACSSSLIALHLACQELRTGTSDMALVGGANLVYHPNFMKTMSDFNFLSKESRCFSFDECANGYARGEGVAVLVVKRLDDALRDGNTIRAVVRNSGSNQDGRTPGITQPSGIAQVNLIENTYRLAGIDMRPTRFFQAHATGTAVGDPIEGNAIGKAFQKYRTKEDPLYVGAIKANIGHLEGCSGLAGVIITLIVLEKGIIPPVGGLKTLNNRIDAKRLHLSFPTEPIPWPDEPIRRACVNSFGFGGTNAVVILDDAYNYLRLKGLRGLHRSNPSYHPYGVNEPARQKLNGYRSTIHTEVLYNPSLSHKTQGHPDRAAKVLVLSAPDEQGMHRLVDLYHDYVKTKPSTFDYGGLSNALVTKRTLYPWRSFLSITRDGCSATSSSFSKPIRALQDPKLAFVFTGQGAQYVGMGQELSDMSTFRDSVAACDTILKSLDCEWSALAVLDGTRNDLNINAPDISQPLATVLQIALVDLLKSFGIIPVVVLGHSSGEIAAAYASRSISREAAVKVAYCRGVCSSYVANTMNGLAMMSVGLPKESVMRYFKRLEMSGQRLDIQFGCLNSPANVTLTGNADQLGILKGWIDTDGGFARMLNIPIAYHSRYMNIIAKEYIDQLQDMAESPVSFKSVPMISTVTGELATTGELSNPEYWALNLTSSVEFEKAFTKLLAHNSAGAKTQLGKRKIIPAVTHVLEIGPHHALRSSIREMILAHQGSKPQYLPSLARGSDASLSILNVAGHLHCSGFFVDLLRVNGVAADLEPLDMPLYPFNHAQKYWKESTLSRNFRFRDTPRHDLLGTRATDWNPLMAIWRNVMRLVELPWIQDHKIGGIAVLPGAAIIAMAIEAYQQVHGSSTPFAGIHVHDASFLHAISFPSGVSEVETQFVLMPTSQSLDSSIAHEYRLFLLEGGKYIQCARGLIQGVFNEAGKIKATHGPWKSTNSYGDWVTNVRDECIKPIDDPYRAIAGTDLQYGPSFQNLSSVAVGKNGQISAAVDINQWEVADLKYSSSAFMLHPATLDGIIQSCLHSVMAKLEGDLPTMMPVHISDLFINNNIKTITADYIQVGGSSNFHGHKHTLSSVIAVDPNLNIPLVYINELETKPIGSETQAEKQYVKKQRRLCTKLLWKPEIDTLTSQDLLWYCTRERPEQMPNAALIYRQQKIAIMCFIEEALRYLDENPYLQVQGHLKSYVDWMRYQSEQFRGSDLDSTLVQNSVSRLLQDQTSRQALEVEVENAPGDGFFFMKIGRSLLPILRGDTDPLNVIFRDGLADRYYEEMLNNDHHAYPAAQIIDILSFKNPGMKIMEVGAGTGGQTLRLLETMEADGVQKWGQYDYTDISPAFFTNAKEKFQKYLGLMRFQVCDISTSPVDQGFEENTYDLVIASHVLHATDRLPDTLRNIRRLLKPYGKLLLFETTAPHALPIGFAFGLLKGWWQPLSCEERAMHSPCVTVDRWNTLLKDAGFSGVDVDIPGQQDPLTRTASIILSTACEAKQVLAPTPVPEALLVVDHQMEIQVQAAKSLQLMIPSSIAASTGVFTLAELAQHTINESSFVIFLSEVDAVFISSMAEHDYVLLQSVLTRSKNVMWVTRVGTIGDMRLKQHLSSGLGRALMSEDSTRKFVRLELAGKGSLTGNDLGYISELARMTVNLPVEDLDFDYAVIDKRLHICRLSEFAEMDEKVSQAIRPRVDQEVQLASETQLEFDSSPSVSRLTAWREPDDSKYRPDYQLSLEEIKVRVQTIALDFRNHLIDKGEINAAKSPTACAGIVLECGDRSEFRPGDQVCFITASKPCSVSIVKAEAAVLIPSNLSFSHAVAMCTSQWVAYHALVGLARLREGDVVLVHQGHSCVGQMAIQLARKLKAQVLATTSSAAKAEFLSQTIQVPESNVFLTDDPAILGKINAVTKQRGVDVVFGSFSYRTSVDFSLCLGPCGRLIETSAPGQSNKRLLSNCSSSVVDMAGLLEKRPEMSYSVFRRAMSFAFEQCFKPPETVHTFTAADILLAQASFDDMEKIGKRVIVLEPDTKIMANVRTRPTYQFIADATYIVGGGLGGLGRSITRWMASRGARHFILPSRSGPSTDVTRSFIAELEKAGISVAAPKVDLTNSTELGHVLETLAQSMPPIRGCIQCATVLRDSTFGNMSYDDWRVCVESKATSSWNLHDLLPANLDFFIMLASVNGIFGGRAQANYAAANAYQDALAHHRRSIGEKAISIDLGLMVGEGIVAEDAELLNTLRRWGQFMDVEQNELLALLDHYCDPSLSMSSESQIVIGVETTTAIRAKGTDVHHSFHRPIFRQLFRMDTQLVDEKQHNGITTIDYPAALAQAPSDDAAGDLAMGWLKAKIAQILNLQEVDVDEQKPVHVYGIDSLVAINLRNWFKRELGYDIQVFVLMGNRSLGELAREAARSSTYRAR
ncbi:lovastatin nonaketide synthase [Xylariaceae sp. FL0255]|nr:lovastatin nonaketide synthase [Xylariaceae sp. FL0255]